MHLGHVIGIAFTTLLVFVALKYVLRRTQYGSFAEMF